MVTIKDVAKLAGVSYKSVANVVNKKKGTKPDTVRKVEEAIRQLDYVPNRAARATRAKRSGIIGLLTEAVATTPYSVDIIRGVQDALNEVSDTLLIANSGVKMERERECFRTFREHRIDGILYSTYFLRPVTLTEDNLKTPVILLNCYDPNRPNLYSVLPDDYQGGYDAAMHVVRAGHRSIGYISLNPKLMAHKLRLKAFKDVLAENEIEIKSEFILPGLEGPIGQDHLIAYEGAMAMLSRSDRPTALVCGNDEVALQVYSAAHALGLRIPEDIAVMGFDDFKVVSEVVRPKMSTVRLPLYEMGHKAVSLLNELTSGEPNPQRMIRLPCPLIDRGSV